MDDEKDEMEYGVLEGHTRTMVWDVRTLDIPVLVDNFYSTETAIDHNQYIHNGFSYQANYCAGLRILDTSKLGEVGSVKEVAWFDIAPQCDEPVFTGAWSNYPYFKP